MDNDLASCACVGPSLRLVARGPRLPYGGADRLVPLCDFFNELALNYLCYSSYGSCSKDILGFK